MKNNNDNKKSSSDLWVRRFFKQSRALQGLAHGKTYFSHRYRCGASIGEQSPFAALFSEEPKDHSNNGEKRFGFDYGTGQSIKQSAVADFYQTVESKRLTLKGNDSYAVPSGQFTVLNCYDETYDTKTFRLGRLDGQSFDYLPGQYITVTVMIVGQEYKRSYSLASSPSHLGILEITVKRAPNGGVVSNWLNDHLKIGDTLMVKGPFGKFSCANKVQPKVLFMAAGSGIVPIMSMVRWLAETEAKVDVILLLSFRTWYDIIYRDELQLIAHRHENIKLFITLTNEPVTVSQWRGLVGRINERMLVNLVHDLSERTVYLCGPETFMAESKQNLVKLGLPAEHLLCESFSINQTIAQQPVKRTTGSYQIRFAQSGKAVAADGVMTVLEIAEQYGIAIEHECRAGTCGECMVKCLSGHLEMGEQAEIDENDRKKGWVYACCAYPTTNVILDA